MNLQLYRAIIKDFVIKTWGKSAMDNLPERAARVLEEAAELAQSEEVPQEVALKILERVYSRPPGEPKEEAGDVMFTLLAHSSTRDYEIDIELAKRISRVTSIPTPVLQQRHVEKRIAGTLLYEE